MLLFMKLASWTDLLGQCGKPGINKEQSICCFVP